MGQATGMTGGQIGLSLLKSGLGGLGQGLQNYANPRQGFDFSKLQQASQVQQPAFGAGITPNAKKNPLNLNINDPALSAFYNGANPFGGGGGY